MIINMREKTYEERLKSSGLWILAQRRNRQDIIWGRHGSVETQHWPHRRTGPKHEGSLMLPGHTSQCTRERSKPLVRVGRCGKGYFAERGIWNAESCERVICGKFNADFFLRNEG